MGVAGWQRLKQRKQKWILEALSSNVIAVKDKGSPNQFSSEWGLLDLDSEHRHDIAISTIHQTAQQYSPALIRKRKQLNDNISMTT